MALSRVHAYTLLALLLAVFHGVYASRYVDVYARHHLAGGDTAQARKNAKAAAKEETVPSPGWNLAGLVVMQTVYIVIDGLSRGGFLLLPTQIRLPAMTNLSVAGLLCSLAFAGLWIPEWLPWVPSAVTFTASTAVFQGLFRLAEGHLWTILGDASARPSERDRCIVHAATYTVFASVPVAAASVLYEGGGIPPSSSDSLLLFRLFGLTVATMGGCGFVLLDYGRERGLPSTAAATGVFLSSLTQQLSSSSPNRSVRGPLSPLQNGGPRRGGDRPGASDDSLLFYTDSGAPSQQFWAFAKQTLRRPSMRAAAVVYALQEFIGAINTGFFSLCLVLVCRGSLSPYVRTFVLFLSWCLPHCIFAATTPLHSSLGKRRLVAALLLTGLLVCLSMVTLGVAVARGGGGAQPKTTAQKTGTVDSTAGFLFAVLAVFNRALSEAVRLLRTAVLSDVADEDTFIFGRARPAVAPINELTAMAAAPAQTVAPMLACVFLVFSGSLSADALSTGTAAAGRAAVVIIALGGAGAGVAVASLAVWLRLYNLDGKHLQFIQMALRKRIDEEEVEEV